MNDASDPNIVIWDSWPFVARNGAGGDLYPLLLLMRPHLLNVEWRMLSEIDAVGPGLGRLDHAQANNTILSTDDLIEILTDISQVIDGRFTGLFPATRQTIELVVTDNCHLDLYNPPEPLLNYLVSMFGPPTS